MGLVELLPGIANQEYISAWGLYDDSLFGIAYDNFLELSEADHRWLAEQD